MMSGVLVWETPLERKKNDGGKVEYKVKEFMQVSTEQGRQVSNLGKDDQIRKEYVKIGKTGKQQSRYMHIILQVE